ncbi:XRE family transcriptional regulator [Ectopseudomonas oleovorans]|jgi:phage repressor protein C with HTH and peptisase S24 domain|nr:helix-turn-helix transcriptional regulator [Pseudomonas indoloxydans]
MHQQYVYFNEPASPVNLLFMDTHKHSGERLRAYLQEKGIRYATFAAMLGVDPQNVNNWFSRGVPANKHRDVCKQLGLSFEWLLDGTLPKEASWGGASTTTVGASAQAEITGSVEEWSDDTPLDDDTVALPFLKEVELAAGSGLTAVERSSNKQLRFGKYSLKKEGVQAEHAVAVTVRGNSMEPVLPDGATVAVNTIDKTITDGKTYAINHAGQLRVKLLYRLPGGGLRIRSYNRDEHPDEEYTPAQVQEQEISVIGRVFWGAMFF